MKADDFGVAVVFDVNVLHVNCNSSYKNISYIR